MRTVQWAVSAVVAVTVAATTACGSDQVSVTPAGAASDSTCAAQSGCGEADGASSGTGQGAGIRVGAGGASVTDGHGAGIEIGANGATVADGRGSGVTVDGTDASVVAGSGGGVTATGGVTGTVELDGAVSWSGAVSGDCSRVGNTRSVDATLPGVGSLQIQVFDADTAAVTLVQQDRSWAASYLNNAADVVTIGNGSTQLRGARLSGGRGTVDVTARFDC